MRLQLRIKTKKMKLLPKQKRNYIMWDKLKLKKNVNLSVHQKYYYFIYY